MTHDEEILEFFKEETSVLEAQFQNVLRYVIKEYNADKQTHISDIINEALWNEGFLYKTDSEGKIVL